MYRTKQQFNYVTHVAVEYSPRLSPVSNSSHLRTRIRKAANGPLRCRIDILVWNVRALDLIHHQRVAVQVPKPWMRQYLIRPHVSQPLFWVLHHQLCAQRRGQLNITRRSAEKRTPLHEQVHRFETGCGHEANFTKARAQRQGYKLMTTRHRVSLCMKHAVECARL